MNCRFFRIILGGLRKNKGYNVVMFHKTKGVFLLNLTIKLHLAQDIDILRITY